MHKPSSHDTMTALVRSFAAAAAAVEAHRADAMILDALREAASACRRVVSDRPAGANPDELLNVQAALSTWQEVWPRLGGQREFRQAVAREARWWMKRFEQAG